MTNEQKQCLLKYLGYYGGPVNGIWTDECKDAATRFQKEFGGIAVDGIVGAETEKAMKHAVAYDMLKAADVPGADVGNTTGTFWDSIQHFTREEFRCPCPRCGGFPVEPKEKLVRLADRVRGYFGKPMTVSSGVRCQAHNDELPGSVPNSLHVSGRAVDFSVSGFSASSVLDYVRTQPDVNYAYAIDSKFVHMDVK